MALKRKNSKRRGLMLVISAPSGTGKSTLLNLLMQVDKHIHPSISYTTRPMRTNEIEGEHYFFIDRNKFQSMVDAGEFIEYVEVYGEYYGTPLSFVENKMRQGEDLVFDIDFKGHRHLISRAKEDVVSVFILPPSKKELLSRLRIRGQNNIDSIKTRLSKADEEMYHWNEYDYTIINKDLNSSLKKLIAILRAERLKKARRVGVAKFVQSLIEEQVQLDE